MLFKEASDTPVKRLITGSVHVLNSVHSICSAIDKYKILWLRKACNELIPQWLPPDAPGHDAWLEQHLGVVRTTIFAFASLGIPQTSILINTLYDRGYTDCVSLFLKEHMLTSMIGPSLVDIVNVQPGFMCWVEHTLLAYRNPPSFQWIMLMRATAAARTALQAAQSSGVVEYYFNIFPRLENLIATKYGLFSWR